LKFHKFNVLSPGFINFSKNNRQLQEKNGFSRPVGSILAILDFVETTIQKYSFVLSYPPVFTGVTAFAKAVFFRKYKNKNKHLKNG